MVRLRNSLFTRLLASHLLLASLPILVTGWVLVRTAQNSIETAVRSESQGVAQRTADLIDQTLVHARQILKLLAENPAISAMNRINQEITINRAVKDFQAFRTLTVVDTEGRRLVTTEFSEFLGTIPIDSILADTRAGRPFTSGVRISEELLPYMILSEPIFHLNELRGALVVRLNLKAVWELVERSKLGASGATFVIDEAGTYIAHTDRSRVHKKERLGEPTLRMAVAHGDRGTLVYRTPSGDEAIAAYCPLPTMPWGVVAQQSTREAFAPAGKMRVQVGLLILLSVAVASGVSFVLARRMVRPVDALLAGIERYSMGDLSFRISESGADEIGRLTREFNEMANRLLEYQEKVKRTERLEIMNKMSSILSHEIRNPLNAMVINMQVLKRELAKSPVDATKVDNYYRIVNGEIRRVDQLVTNFLLYARPQKLKMEPVMISELVDEVVTAQRQEARNRKVQIQFDVGPEAGTVQGDRATLKQVFLNLMLNALEAMEHGGRLDILVNGGCEGASLKRRGRFTRVRFSDTGPGIDEETLPRIFEFYYSTKRQGSGIGLSVAQQVIEEHGGWIDVESRPNEGTRFLLYLPEM